MSVNVHFTLNCHQPLFLDIMHNTYCSSSASLFHFEASMSPIRLSSFF